MVAVFPPTPGGASRTAPTTHRWSPTLRCVRSPTRRWRPWMRPRRHASTFPWHTPHHQTLQHIRIALQGPDQRGTERLTSATHLGRTKEPASLLIREDVDRLLVGHVGPGENLISQLVQIVCLGDQGRYVGSGSRRGSAGPGATGMWSVRLRLLRGGSWSGWSVWTFFFGSSTTPTWWLSPALLQRAVIPGNPSQPKHARQLDLALCSHL